MQARHLTIDYAKTIGIYLVIVGHLVQMYSSAYIFIYSFHIPLFFFLSGTLFKTNYNARESIARSYKKIIMPYLWFSMISFLSRPFMVLLLNINNFSFHILTNKTFQATAAIMYGTHSSLLQIWNSPLWFLPCLFSTHVLFQSLYKKGLLKLFLVVILMQFIIQIIGRYVNPHMPYNRLIFGMDSAFIGLMFFYLGFVLKKSNFLQTISNVNISILLTVFLLFSSLFVTLILFYPTNLDIAVISQGNYPFLSYSLAVLGIIIILSLSAILAQVLKQSNIIEFISRNTLTIFATHVIIIAYLLKLEHILKKSFHAANNVLCAYALLVLFLCMVIAYLVENYVPLIISKERIKTNIFNLW